MLSANTNGARVVEEEIKNGKLLFSLEFSKNASMHNRHEKDAEKKVSEYLKWWYNNGYDIYHNTLMIMHEYPIPPSMSFNTHIMNISVGCKKLTEIELEDRPLGEMIESLIERL